MYINSTGSLLMVVCPNLFSITAVLMTVVKLAEENELNIKLLHTSVQMVCAEAQKVPFYMLCVCVCVCMCVCVCVCVCVCR